MVHHCYECKFWNCLDPSRFYDDRTSGECRKHAPVSEVDCEGNASRWPITFRKDGCGDWQHCTVEQWDERTSESKEKATTNRNRICCICQNEFKVMDTDAPDLIRCVDCLEETASWFKEKCMDRLCENQEKKSDWSGELVEYLRDRADKELTEVFQALADWDESEIDAADVIKECSDAANFLMMIAETVKRVEEEEWKKE